MTPGEAERGPPPLMPRCLAAAPCRTNGGTTEATPRWLIRPHRMKTTTAATTMLKMMLLARRICRSHCFCCHRRRCRYSHRRWRTLRAQRRSRRETPPEGREPGGSTAAAAHHRGGDAAMLSDHGCGGGGHQQHARCGNDDGPTLARPRGPRRAPAERAEEAAALTSVAPTTKQHQASSPRRGASPVRVRPSPATAAGSSAARCDAATGALRPPRLRCCSWFEGKTMTTM